MKLASIAAGALALTLGTAQAAVTVGSTHVGNNLGNGQQAQDTLPNVIVVVVTNANGLNPAPVPPTNRLAKLDNCDSAGNNCNTLVDDAVMASLFTMDDANDEVTFDLTGTGFQLEFFSVKGGNGFSVYALDNPVVQGTFAWDTNDLFVGNGNNPALSHISFFGSRLDDIENPVPVPAAALLFPAGLAGLGLARRRRQK
jgi:hypothetical protein